MWPLSATPLALSAAVMRSARWAATEAAAAPAAILPSAERRESLVFMMCSDGLSDGLNIHPGVHRESNSNPAVGSGWVRDKNLHTIGFFGHSEKKYLEDPYTH